jgi:hypothetical protein
LLTFYRSHFHANYPSKRYPNHCTLLSTLSAPYISAFTNTEHLTDIFPLSLTHLSTNHHSLLSTLHLTYDFTFNIAEHLADIFSLIPTHIYTNSRTIGFPDKLSDPCSD